MQEAKLVLQDGSEFSGTSFGAPKSMSGEVVFNTGMTGYPESLSDPSYRGQILVLTFPLIGNYGVPAHDIVTGLEANYESRQIQVRGLIVSAYSVEHSHWKAVATLADWLKAEGIPALMDVDTRTLTKLLREHGTMLGAVHVAGQPEPYDPAGHALVQEVSVKEVQRYGKGDKTVLVIDCGAKHQILHHLLAMNLEVIVVPWDYDFTQESFDGIMVSNGPGDPEHCVTTIRHLREQMGLGTPIFGICLGHQLLALAAGAETYKMKYGHRGQNQPVIEVGTNTCFVTSQNHGYAVRDDKLPAGWRPWYRNLNDGSNEGLIHESGRFKSVQFHPEASPGPMDARFLFQEFRKMLP